MADSEGPVCSNCKATSSLMWHRNKSGAILCLECHNAEKAASLHSESAHTTASADRVASPPRTTSPTVTTRRATRSREKNSRAKQNQAKSEKQSSKPVDNHVKAQDNHVKAQETLTSAKDRVSYHYQQQRGRRSLFKQQPMKSPLPQPVVITSESVTHKGTKYEVGDIVSLLDRDGGVYYAVIRGFLLDEYAEKHAVLTWLLPRHPNPTHFDPSLFVLGPEEDMPRSIDYLNFVSHSPQSRHFQASYFHDIQQAELWRHS